MVGLLLDCGEGTPAVYKNGAGLGEAVRPGIQPQHHKKGPVAELIIPTQQVAELCWVEMIINTDSVTTERKPVPV